MAVYLVTGPPGEGKTAFTVRKIGRSLRAGVPVVTNVQVRPDAGEFVARHTVSRLRPGLRRRRAARADDGLLVIDELATLFDVRVPPNREGSWVVVLDEAGTWLNSRAWSAEGRSQMIEWFAQHRKLGADVFLIAQDEEMIDKQVRGLVNEHIELRNIRKFKKWGVPIFKVLPRPVFVALTTWRAVGGTKIVVGREVYSLGWWKDLYDTRQIVAGDYSLDHPDAIVLPRSLAGSFGGPESRGDDEGVARSGAAEEEPPALLASLPEQDEDDGQALVVDEARWPAEDDWVRS